VLQTGPKVAAGFNSSLPPAAAGAAVGVSVRLGEDANVMGHNELQLRTGAVVGWAVGTAVG